MPIRCFAIAISLAAAACAAPPRPAGPTPVVAVEAPEQRQWQVIATAADSGRLERIDAAWSAALAEARVRGFADEIEAEGPLLDPTAAQPRAAPTPGHYMCRVVKLGAQAKGDAVFRAYKPFFCYVAAEGDLLIIVKQTGSQRPDGWLYPDGDKRLVFLGTLALGGEEASLPYGEKPERDIAGVVERVAPFRWRLVMPWPRAESKLDVLELVPAAQ